jgi:translocation and assembly module TamA
MTIGPKFAAQALSPRLSSIGLALWLVVPGAVHAAMELSGVEGPVAENVRAFLRIDEQPCAADDLAVRREFADAPAQIRSALEAFGFYAPTIESNLEFAADCWAARFAITPGEPVRIRTLDMAIAGAAQTDPAFIAARNDSLLQTGSPLQHGAYEQLKRRLLNLSRDRGYAAARFTDNRIEIYPDELAADVTLHFDSGERYRFGEVVVQQDVLREDFVANYITIAPGEPYNNALLTETYVALTNSGYFDIIDVRPSAPDHDDRTIGVTVVLTGAPRRFISYGVGFSTDQGPRLRFGRNFRRWNERGHQLGINAQLSPVTSEVIATYRYPFGDPRFQWMVFDGGLKREDTETAESEILEFAARRISQRSRGWSRTELLSWHVEDFEVADQIGRSRLLMPGVDWTRLRGDEPLRPTNGSRIDLRLRSAGDALGSDTTFLQGMAEAKWIKSLRNDGRVITRGLLGLTREDDFEELPPTVRFFAGGDRSIRGYDFESLGPEDEQGQVVGGTGIAVASIEYEHPVRGLWSVAFFVDSGNAFKDSDFVVKTSAGIGARWQSPLGPIRLDVGVPINDPEHGARLHLSIGPDL